MTFFKRLVERLRTISRRQAALGALSAVLLFLVLMGVIYAWDYTNSPTFCGTTCHTMPPEFNAWQRSPHARVNCVECHLGRDIVTTTFTRKAGDIMHLVRYSSGQFNFPVYAESMLPARESCERCHWPEKFANDRAVTITHYDTDEKNTQVATYLLMKTGGGSEREGRGKGIHWHIENQVYFVATDELKQNIPWVQVVENTGKVTTFTDVENPITGDEVSRLEKHRMDCIDCHNRISHTFRSPDKAVDDAIALKRIDSTIPFIKKNAVDALSASYKTFDEANKAIEALEPMYQKSFPDYYNSHAVQIRAAIDYLKTTYQSLVFPSQDLSWTTHPDNIGHKDAPGCFRCHDGKHFTSDNKQVIRLECNICHTLPEVSTPGGPAPVISMVRSGEPDSHADSTWLAQHRTVFNSTCQTCHDTNNAGGKDNSSFCSNSACHGSEWRYAGLNAVGLAKIFPPPVSRNPDPNASPKAIPHPIGGNPDCQICHSQASKVRPYPSDHVGRKNDVCTACHKPTLAPTSSTPTAGTSGTATNTSSTSSSSSSSSSSSASSNSASGNPPSVPHDTAGRTQCLGCHGSGAGAIPQVPKFHIDSKFGNEMCLGCHKSSAVPQPSRTPGSSSSSSASSSASQSSAGGPPAIPASHAGRVGCAACHAQGVLGAPKFPANHAGRTEDTCKGCHKGP